MQIKQETITPRKAEELLKLNTHNRTLRPRRVMQYARTMERGEWDPDTARLTPIAINGRELVTGQHRLAAVIEAGKPVKMFVARGVPRRVRDTIDTGMALTFTDQLKMDGEPYPPVLAGSIRQLYLYETEKILGGKLKAGTTPSHAELLKVLARWPDVRDAVTRMSREMMHAELRNTGSPSLVAASYCVFARVDKEDAEEFFSSLLTGAELAIGNPILAMRRMMVESRRKPHPRVLGACLVKAWNAWRDGDTIYLLSWKGNQETFPEVH